jgi:lysophospholipase L1-like esterase
VERTRWSGVRAAAARAALALASTAAGLLAAELVTRLTGGGVASANRAQFFDYDPEVGWRCRADLDLRFVEPGTCDVRVRCNSRGLRDREHALAKPDRVRRIVVLGDSYAWGQGVENDQTFAAVLERALPGVETINLGVAAYTSVQELVLFEEEGVRYAPDWTVLLFCDNDLDSNFDDKDGRRPFVASADGEELRIANRPVPPAKMQPLTEWLHHHSRLVLEFDWCFGILREWRDEKRAAARGHAASSETAHGEMGFSLLDRFLPPDARMDRAWRTLGTLYARLRDDAAEHGSRLLVAYVPDPRLAIESTFHDLVDRAGVPRERADWNRPAKRLAEVCAGIGVPCLDLAPTFRAAPRPADLFLEGDPHWSAAGAELAARQVAAKLRELDAKFGEGR